MGAALLRVAEGPGCRLFAGRGDERRGLLPGYVPVGRPERGEGARVEAYALETSAGSFRGSRDRFESVVSWLDGEEAADLTHAELEARLEVDGRELLRQLLQDHQDLRAERETRPAAVIGAGGVARGSAEAGRERKLATVFGDVQVRRVAYRARGHADLHPADGALNLPDEQYSHGLRRLAAIESARGSFAESAASVEQITAQRLGNRQLAQLAQRAAVDFDQFYASRPRHLCEAGEVLVLSCDGKGIVMRPQALRAATATAAGNATRKLATRLSKGEKRNRKRMAEVGAVYDATPVPRTPGDILPAADTPPSPGPKARGKWLVASVTHDAAKVIGQVFDEAARRDPGQHRTWVALVDGNTHQIQRIQAEARTRGADTAATYLTNKRPYLDYPTALEAGWPIATGVIEGACRHLVQDRMDLTGARWGLDGAKAILKLRALRSNGDFDTYWAYHLAQERQRVHQARYANGVRS